MTQGTGPHLSLAVDAGSNRVTGGGATYDAAGHQTGGPGFSGATYDAESRMVSVNHERYAYSHTGQRVLRQRLDANWQVTDEAVWLYSPQGERVAELSLAMDNLQTAMYLQPQRRWAYFAGRQVGLAEDRLGSGRARRLAPYGEELGTATANDADKFATYHRDQGTGLDYAQQRYYSSAWGRFTSPDPYQASGGPAAPQSWNRYAYVNNDPVNWYDPRGLEAEDPTFRVTVIGSPDPLPNAGGGPDIGAMQVVNDGPLPGGSSPELTERSLALSAAVRGLSGLARAALDRSDCRKDLERLGLTASAVRGAAGRVAGPVIGNGHMADTGVLRGEAPSGRTVDQLFADPNVHAWSPEATNVIYIQAWYWAGLDLPDLPGKALAAMMHEVLHRLLGSQLHARAGQAWGSDEPTLPSQGSFSVELARRGSIAITDKLLKDCF